MLRFFEDNRHEVSFHTYLQYRADNDLQAAQRAARDAGMRIGLIADLAVGADHGGSQAWSYQDQVLRGLELGAPPDSSKSRRPELGHHRLLAARSAQ